MKTTAVILVVIVAGAMGAMAASFYFIANPKIVISTVVMTTVADGDSAELHNTDRKN